jgi:glyoxylase-like metal-dependent hydrolase (beta-lactamase superfamily II)
VKIGRVTTSQPVRRLSWMATTAISLIGAPLVAIGATFVAARGTALPLPLAAALAGLAPVTAVAVFARRSRRIGAAGLVMNLAVAVFLGTYCASPLPRPAPLGGSLPPASSPAGMALFQLPTGVIHRTAAFGYRGGAFSERRDFAMTAALVKHPRGDLLIDTGLGRDIATQLPLMPAAFRAITDLERGQPAADQLDAAGHDRARLRGILLTHAHWDHVSGTADFPGVPVLVTADERRFVDQGGWITAIARSVTGARYEVYDFEGGPYLGFPRSHDVFGDGAVVVVPAPGHTPGSVIVFVALPDGRRFAFVGDLAWQQEGITEREERPWSMRRSADDDPAQVRDNLLRMAAIAERFPQITLVPAHDVRGFAGLPRL